MKKIYIAPVIEVDEFDMQPMLQQLSGVTINGGAHDHDPYCTCDLCLGEDDEEAASKKRRSWFSDDSYGY